MIKELLKLIALFIIIACLVLLVCCTPGRNSHSNPGVSLNGDQLFALEEKLSELNSALEEAQFYAFMIEESVYSLEDVMPLSDDVSAISHNVRKMESELTKVDNAYDSVWSMIHKK